MTIAGLFPALAPDQVGGIQTAGRLALDVLGTHANSHGESLRLISWGRTDTPLPGVPTATPKTKAGVAIQSLLLPRSTRSVLAWHVGFMRAVHLIRARSATVICYLHGVEAWRPLEHRLAPVVRSERFRLLIAFHSQHVWERFAEVNPRYASLAHRVVELGIGEPISGPTPEPQSPPALLMLGRMTLGENYKGHREIIDAWPQVLTKFPDAQLWVAGEGDLRTSLEELVRTRRLQSSVRFFGLVSEEEKLSLLSRCRGLALPSRGEGFGLVYLEAMRLGRPCLVSGLDAGHEVVADAGLAVDPSRRSELVDALCRLLSASDEWRGWSLRARSRYESQFTAADFRRRLAALFDEVWDGPSSRSASQNQATGRP